MDMPGMLDGPLVDGGGCHDQELFPGEISPNSKLTGGVHKTPQLLSKFNAVSNVKAQKEQPTLHQSRSCWFRHPPTC